MNKHFEALELNIVLDMLAAEASCPDAAVHSPLESIWLAAARSLSRKS